MALGHPLDELGRVLPDPAWPADKAAPDRWDMIRRFCNTANHESGADRFETDEGLTRWTVSEGLGATKPSADQRVRIVDFREHVRAHALAHHDGADHADLDAILADHVAELELALVVIDGRLEAAPAAVDVANQTIGAIAIAIMGAQRDDCWKRFKACPGCEWVFYDRSKNQSGRWCSMSACGGRAKVAAFRAREKESAR
ncbi:CGNR zinc finger domain-containing protein [Ilumatobacter sp.]|uniref:CGNR zinc finger domain-containing protein n=1 Tax=Ilumatobacter sp. TaxID=1967498 RepID=UPI003C58B426